MSWNDWLTVVLEPHPLTHRREEGEQELSAELAPALQSRLRGRLDAGVAVRGAARAQTVRVVAEGNRLVIDEGEDHGVTGGRRGPSRRVELDDLFHTSLEAPEVLDDGRIAFRVLDEAELASVGQSQDEVVDRTVREVVDEQFIEALERAVRKVELAHPADRLR